MLLEMKAECLVKWRFPLTPDRAVQVRALAIVTWWCSWASHFSLIVPLSTQVWKWVPVNLMLGASNPAFN